MTAEDDALRGAVGAGERHQHVAGGVDGDFQPDRFGRGADQVVRALLAGSVGVAGDAYAIGRCRAEHVEQLLRPGRCRG